MKTSTKFIIIFIALTFVFSLVSAQASLINLNKIKAASNQNVLQLIANIRQEYPNVSDSDIASVLNGNADKQNAEKILQSYGIDSDDWISYDDEKLSSNAVTASAIVSLLSGLALLVVFVLYCLRQKKKTAEVTGYLSKLNQGDYDLKINENSEEELSLLKNEIFKTTVMLREQAENSLNDKEKLKQSLQDISHQLKTPITSVIILVENMIDNAGMPRELQLEFLEDIRHCASSISFLVQSLLTLSKLDANTITLQHSTQSVSQVFEECVKNTAVLAEIKQVSVTADCNRDIKMKCDFKWLCEAISNVLKNCIEHTPKGGRVELYAEQNNLYTKLTISDNGCGIVPEDLPHIFERFYKGKNSDENSVGIGLALAKTIIEKNGGYITVDSALNKGTTFTIKYFAK